MSAFCANGGDTRAPTQTHTHGLQNNMRFTSDREQGSVVSSVAVYGLNFLLRK